MRKFLSVVLYLAIGLPMAFSTLLVFSARPWALDRDFYKRTLTNDKLYAALESPDLIKNAEPILDLGGIRVSGPVFLEAARTRIPEKELKALSVSAVDKAFDWFEGKTEGRSELDLAPLKAAITAAEPALAGDYVKALPTGPAKPDPNDLSYRPVGESEAQMTGIVTKDLREKTLSAIPDKLAWPGVDQPSFRNGRRLAGLDAGIMSPDRVNRGLTSLAVLSSLLIAGLGFLGGRRAVDRLGMAGTYILIPSVAVLAIGATMAIAGGSIVSGALPAEIHGALSTGGSALMGYIADVLRGMSKGFFITGLVGTCVGGLVKSLRRTVDPERIE